MSSRYYFSYFISLLFVNFLSAACVAAWRISLTCTTASSFAATNILCLSERNFKTFCGTSFFHTYSNALVNTPAYMNNGYYFHCFIFSSFCNRQTNFNSQHGGGWLHHRFVPPILLSSETWYQLDINVIVISDKIWNAWKVRWQIRMRFKLQIIFEITFIIT